MKTKIHVPDNFFTAKACVCALGEFVAAYDAWADDDCEVESYSFEHMVATRKWLAERDIAVVEETE